MRKRVYIRSAIQAGIRILTVVCGVVLLLLPTGCVKDGMGDCANEIRLYIVAESESADFADQVDGAILFLFNDDGTYRTSIPVSAADIAGNVPIVISYERDNIPWAVVWGNTGSAELISPPAPGETMQSMTVSMAKDADEYTVPSDNLYFGRKKLSGDAVERVVITPKTGRIVITVRGLPPGDPSDQYFFTVTTPCDRYDFAGQPLPAQTDLLLPGIFRGTDLVTQEAYHLFHFPDTGSGNTSLSVRLYRRSGGSDDAELLADVNGETNGEPIVILRERTTNLLIDLETAGQINIRLVVTNWHEIHQWGIW